MSTDRIRARLAANSSPRQRTAKGAGPQLGLTSNIDQYILSIDAVHRQTQMRLDRIVILASIAALSAMALVGPSSASATGITAACKASGKICSENNLVNSIHLNNTEGLAISLINPIANILCLGVLAKTPSLQVGIPQKINTESFSFTGCGTTLAHSNCTVAFSELPSFTLLQTAENLGILKVAKGKLLVKCEIGGVFKIDCSYNAKDLEFTAKGALFEGGPGHGKIAATEALLTPEGAGKGECPKETKLNLSLEPSEHVYIASIENQSTALCKVHEEPCQKANWVTSLHTETKDFSFIVEYSGNPYAIVCAKSLTNASVSELGSPQIITIEELTWTNCKTTGGGHACTIKSIQNPELSLYKVGLNVGEATSSEYEIEVSCPNPGFACFFASEPKLRIEGANHTMGAGNGMLEANEPELENVKGPCEGPGFQYGLNEPLTSIYVAS